jgi:hypothetical protein
MAFALLRPKKYTNVQLMVCMDAGIDWQNLCMWKYLERTLEHCGQNCLVKLCVHAVCPREDWSIYE